EAFLVRFDGEEPADWSGSVEVDGGALTALAGWQLDQGDRIDADRRTFTLRTVSEEYWHAPWERSLQGTKQRVRVTERGLVLRLDMRPAGTVRITAGGKQFAIEPETVDWR